jgi:hypothetical protein
MDAMEMTIKNMFNGNLEPGYLITDKIVPLVKVEKWFRNDIGINHPIASVRNVGGHRISIIATREPDALLIVDVDDESYGIRMDDLFDAVMSKVLLTESEG